MTELRYVEGLYLMWDDILKANPSLFIDNCASGGRRIDLETMSRSIPLWRSDNTCDMLDKKAATVLLAAIKNQVMNAGLNRYVPFSTCGQMGANPYLFRSGFNAGIAFFHPDGKTLRSADILDAADAFMENDGDFDGYIGFGKVKEPGALWGFKHSIDHIGPALRHVLLGQTPIHGVQVHPDAGFPFP